MARRALIIASETSGLRGCNADAALIGDMLSGRGFDAIETRTEGDATRTGIIDGFEQLVSAIGPDDTVVVYYSGHGARVARPDFEERRSTGLSVHFQFLVPFDMAASEPGDFRGVLSEELTGFQRRLTQAFRAHGAVPNVTTVLDCCHSGYMARSFDVIQKSVAIDPKSFRMRGIREHANNLSSELLATGSTTNADAVRIVACQPEESAFELPSTRGRRHGALTDALVSVLDEIGPAPVSWSIVGELVRRRVRALVPEQRPGVEGPVDRVVFSADSVGQRNAYAVSVVDVEPKIEAASILGIDVGDEFRLVAAGHDEEIGVAVVDRLIGGDAVLAVTPPDALSVTGIALAEPTRISVPRVRVAVESSDGPVDTVRTRLAEGVRINVVDEAAGAAASVSLEHDGLVLSDSAGDRWRAEPYSDDREGHDQLVQEINAIAVGHRLLDLPTGHAESALPDAIKIRFGTFVEGQQRSLPLRGERLTTGAPVFLSIQNTSAHDLYAWVFDVGVSGRSALLTNAAPSGTALGAAGTEDDTMDLWGTDGEHLFWPGDVPIADRTATATDTSGRWETLVVLVADQRGDLSSLASQSASRRSVSQSPLDALIAEARTGTREVAPSAVGAAPLRYVIEHVQFLLQQH